MRKLAKKVGIAQSVIYYYYPSKDIILKSIFRHVSKQLGSDRHNLPKTKTAAEMLRQRINFQLDHSEQVTSVLKFFLAYRNLFPKIKTGYVPEKAYLHILEVLNEGEKTGEFTIKDKRKDAKVITHAINGFITEYYPNKPIGKEREELVDQIHGFLVRALTN
jgi:AcrR family transcriptional regulator